MVWGAHAPRVLVAAPSRLPFGGSRRVGRFCGRYRCSARARADHEGAVGGTRGRCAPQFNETTGLTEGLKPAIQKDLRLTLFVPVMFFPHHAVNSAHFARFGMAGFYTSAALAAILSLTGRGIRPEFKPSNRRRWRNAVALNVFAIWSRPAQTAGVTTSPLALVLYEELMPGTQLVNRLQDLRYRVQAVSDPAKLVEFAQAEGTMLVFADLIFAGKDIGAVIAQLRRNPATTHIPVIAFADEAAESVQAAARAAGATLVVTDAAILTHLAQFIEQALQVE